MYRLIETVKMKDGQVFNLDYHNRRMNSARKQLFGCNDEIDLSEKIHANNKEGLLKCRVLYYREIEDIQFIPYVKPKIHSLKLVYDNEIAYDFKYEDRNNLKKLFEQREDGDDILIIKNGYVTDTYFCNVAFKKNNHFYMPSTFLLRGTKRQKLLDTGFLKERKIRVEDIQKYESLHLINAMLDIEDNISVNIKNILV